MVDKEIEQAGKEDGDKINKPGRVIRCVSHRYFLCAKGNTDGHTDGRSDRLAYREAHLKSGRRRKKKKKKKQ